MQVKEMAIILAKVKQFLRRGSPSEITEGLAGTWVHLLSDYEDDEIRRVFLEAISKCDFWPSPREIIRLAKGSSLSDTEIGQDVASRIESAIGKFGCYNSKEAEEYIGEIGWETVGQLGGWMHVCETTNDQMISSRKSWREVAAVVSKKLHMNKNNTKGPALPSCSSSDSLLKEALAIASGVNTRSDIRGSKRVNQASGSNPRDLREYRKLSAV